MAWTDCFSKIVRGLLALKLDPNELEGITGQTPADLSGNFAGQSKKSSRAPDKRGSKDHASKDTPDVAEHRAYIRKAILELCDNQAAQAQTFLEYLTTFKARDGDWVKGKRAIMELTAKQVERLYERRDQELTSNKYAEFFARQED